MQQKLQRRNNSSQGKKFIKGKALLIVSEIVAIVVGLFLIIKPNLFRDQTVNNISKFADILEKGKATPTPNPTPTPSPTPTPTPRPLTFAEMNSLYGPCVRLPVLMYHHIQTKDAALVNKQTALTVYTDVFKSQMEYLKSKGYSTITENDLINFFDAGVPVPGKSVILTFDDGYQDFYTDAYPILASLNLRATMFVPTGLIQNPGYLTWDEIAAMNNSVFFANHTWSHKSVVTKVSVMQSEILTADTQLKDRGYNSPKVFAYPYGPDSVAAENYLNSLGYKIAYTTVRGNILCRKQRFNLPRIRIGNTSLSYYGF